MARSEKRKRYREAVDSIWRTSDRELDKATIKPRRKASYVGVPAIFELQMACHVLVKAYGASIYHVGSSLERPDWRDVDLVMIMDDEQFEREFPNAPLHSAAWEMDPKWLVLTVALSKWLADKASVPVDFKFQPRTFANERHNGRRNPIGRYINNQPKADVGEF